MKNSGLGWIGRSRQDDNPSFGGGPVGIEATLSALAKKEGDTRTSTNRSSFSRTSCTVHPEKGHAYGEIPWTDILLQKEDNKRGAADNAICIHVPAVARYKNK